MHKSSEMFFANQIKEGRYMPKIKQKWKDTLEVKERMDIDDATLLTSALNQYTHCIYYVQIWNNWPATAWYNAIIGVMKVS